MPDWSGAGKALILLGVVLFVVGAILTLAGRWAGLGGGLGWLGKLPGDILIKRDHFTLYFPLTTSVLVSLVLSLLLYLLSRR